MYALLVATLLYSSSLFAQTAGQAPAASTQEEAAPLTSTVPAKPVVKGQVSKIYKDTKRIILTVDSALGADGVPSTWEFTNSKSESCEGKTLQSQEKNVFVDFSNCTIFDQITAGAIVSPPLFQNLALESKEAVVPPQAESETPTDAKSSESESKDVSRWNKPRFSIAIGLSGSSKFKFDSAKYSNGVQSAKASDTFDVQNAQQISFLVMKAPKANWGFEAGFTWENKRYVNSMTESVEGLTAHTEFLPPKPSVQFWILEANALYRWGVVYLPFGLNYSMAEFKKGAMSTATITCTGSFGAQLGIGFIAGEHWHFEVLYQQVSADVTISSSTIVADLDNGTLGGLAVRAGLIF